MDDGTDCFPNSPNDPDAGTDRRTFLKAAGLAGIAGAFAGTARASSGIGTTASVAQAQTSAPSGPATGAARPEKWWPSKWGEGDEAGATNHITPEKVLDSIKLIRDGKIYRLGRVYEHGMPLFGQRSFALRIPGGPSGRCSTPAGGRCGSRTISATIPAHRGSVSKWRAGSSKRIYV